MFGLGADLHERLTGTALDTGWTVQTIFVDGAELVLAHLHERHP